MSFDWSLYLQLARELSGRPDDAAKRSAISRAYYSAFHAAHDSLKANNIAMDHRRGSHERVWDVYAKSSRPECQKIGSDGYRLKNARTEADYVADRVPADRKVERHLQEAQSIINSVAMHLPESIVAAPDYSLLRFARCIRKCFKR